MKVGLCLFARLNPFSPYRSPVLLEFGTPSSVSFLISNTIFLYRFFLLSISLWFFPPSLLKISRSSPPSPLIRAPLEEERSLISRTVPLRLKFPHSRAQAPVLFSLQVTLLRWCVFGASYRASPICVILLWTLSHFSFPVHSFTRPSRMFVLFFLMITERFPPSLGRCGKYRTTLDAVISTSSTSSFSF